MSVLIYMNLVLNVLLYHEENSLNIISCCKNKYVYKCHEFYNYYDLEKYGFIWNNWLYELCLKM